jgi:hypothetical protein
MMERGIRDHIRRGHKRTYHRKKDGRAVLKSGRLKYPRVPYDTYPDTPGVQCSAIAARTGERCKNWSVISKTTCSRHGGGPRRLMRPPCRVQACPMGFKNGGRAHRWGSRGCLGWDMLKDRQSRRSAAQPADKPKPATDWRGLTAEEWAKPYG